MKKGDFVKSVGIRGIVFDINDRTALIRKTDGQLVSVLVSQIERASITEGDCITAAIHQGIVFYNGYGYDVIMPYRRASNV